MEIIGLMIMTLTSLAISSALAAVAFLFRLSRRFCLTILATPPFAVASLIMIRWSVLDGGRVCGPDPEWDRCPTVTSSIIGWAVWILGIMIAASAAYLAQRVLQAAYYLFFDRQPISLFGSEPKNSIGATLEQESEP